MITWCLWQYPFPRWWLASKHISHQFSLLKCLYWKFETEEISDDTLSRVFFSDWLMADTRNIRMPFLVSVIWSSWGLHSTRPSTNGIGTNRKIRTKIQLNTVQTHPELYTIDNIYFYSWIMCNYRAERRKKTINCRKKTNTTLPSGFCEFDFCRVCTPGWIELRANPYARWATRWIE